MPNHPSSLKRVRSDAQKRLRNRYQHKSTRTLVKAIRTTKDPEKAHKNFPKVVSQIDKLVKNHIIHKNKAARLKSRIATRLHALAQPSR